MDTTKIYQAINAVSAKVEDMAKRLDDQTVYGIARLTPYLLTKTAYIDDTEVIFRDVPEGNMTIFTDKFINYQASRQEGIVTISFDPLEEITKITLSITKEE